jgi:hypothetical protein
MRPVALLPTILLLALAGSANAKRAIDCVTVASLPSAPSTLTPDAACTIATHPLATTLLPDLGFAAPLCYMTTFTDRLVIDGRSTAGFDVVAYSGVATNRVATAALTPFPSGLRDGDGVSRPLIPFAAATIIEVRAAGKRTMVGQLVSRDTGWAELDLTTGLPGFASERLVVTHGTGRLFDGVRGEIVFSGDQFGAGGLAAGSLCGPQLERRVAKVFR